MSPLKVIIMFVIAPLVILLYWGAIGSDGPQPEVRLDTALTAEQIRVLDLQKREAWAAAMRLLADAYRPHGARLLATDYNAGNISAKPGGIFSVKTARGGYDPFGNRAAYEINADVRKSGRNWVLLALDERLIQ